ncbi:hypothetical protein AABB24_023465 [Solanum stoloniferum]|uniref:Uncharacterized protein n=1 Tax=Solanum stoloniferum TaxID=62892 RepID=A0ABD2SJK2_9SOLN
MLWGEVPLPDAPKSLPTSMPSGELPQSVDEQLSKGDILVDDSIERDEDKADDNLAKKTYGEELWREEDEQRIAATLSELQYLEETMVHATLERSLEDTSAVGTSGVFSDSTIPPINVSGTDALFKPPMIIFPNTNAQECHSS